MRQIARHVGEQHVVGDVGGNHQTGTRQQTTPVFSGDFFKRNLRPFLQPLAIALFQLVDVLLKRRGFFQRVAQIQTNQS
ncbi:hypothetical protein D3C81_2272390 [compost metagenome]